MHVKKNYSIYKIVGSELVIFIKKSQTGVMRFSWKYQLVLDNGFKDNFHVRNN